MPDKRTTVSLWAILVSILVVACGAAPKSGSLKNLEEIIATAPPEEERAGASSQWAEAERYLRLALESREEGRDDAADRMATLGLIHARLAVVSLDEKGAKAKTRKLETNREELRMALEKHQDAVERLLVEEERERLRAHVEAVVDAARLRAAAADQGSQKAEGIAGKEKRERARRQVGEEILARQGVLVSALGVLVKAGLVEPERLSPATGAMEVAAKRLADGDLAGVQEYSERAGMEVRLAWSFMWEQAGETLQETRAGIEEDLTEVLGELRGEELGFSFTVPVSSGKKISVKWSRKLADAAERLREGDAVVLVVSRGKGKGGGEKGKRREDAQAMAVLKKLIDGGVPESNTASFVAGEATPCRSLLDSKDPVAVLIVPVPGS